MLKSWTILNNKNKCLSFVSFWCSNKKKIQEVGFKSQSISDSNKLSYVTNQKVQYNMGRFLIYKHQNTFTSKISRYALSYTILTTIGYLLWTKPYIAVFPAATPILYLIQLITFYLLTRKFKKNQNIASEIYLLDGGSSTQIHYANSLKRKLFGQPLYQTYYNSLFVNPDQKKQQIVSFNLNPFPQNMEDFQKKNYSQTWMKYYSNGENFVLIPKNYKFLNKQILIQVFKGKIIKHF